MRTRPKISAPIIKKTTPDTKFYIDYSWWKSANLDFKTYLYSRLQINDDVIPDPQLDQVDLVDPYTGEVRQVDGFQYAIQMYLSEMPQDFIHHTSLVDSVFYTLLANANRPMTVNEIADYINRSPDIILKTLSGTTIYQGIRPLLDD